MSLASLHLIGNGGIPVLESGAGSLSVMCPVTGSYSSASCTGLVVTGVRIPGICDRNVGIGARSLGTQQR